MRTAVCAAIAIALGAAAMAAYESSARAQSPASVAREWFDVQVEVREKPARGARLIFGLVNGDAKFDNSVVVKNVASAGGAVRPSHATVGTALELEGGFRIDDTPLYVSKWIQQDVTVGTRISFQVGVTRTYPWKATDPYQPDQFSFAVLEAGSNAGFLRSDDSTGANLVLSIDLAPGAAPRAYKAYSPDKREAWTVSVKPTTEPK